MEKSRVNIVTEFIGAMPMIAEYLKRIKLAENIDDLVPPLRSNHRRLSHGKTCFVMMLYLICRPHVMYKVEEWVRDTTYLKVIFPEIEPCHLSDDRIADTLKAMYEYGINNLFSGQTIHIIKEFNLSIEQVHCDFTSFTVHGDYKDATGENSIAITYGYNKEHRPDKKQFVQEVAVTSDGGVPITTQTLDGNTSDVTRYIPVWKDIRQLMGYSDFLTVGDCKLSSEENLLTIAKGNGYYLAPLAMYSSLKKELRECILSSEMSSVSLKEQVKDGKTITYHGFEMPGVIIDSKTEKAYEYRKIFVLSSQLKELKIKGLEEKLKKAMSEIEELKGKLNRFKKLDSVDKIKATIESIVNRYDLQGLIQYNVTEEISVVQKKVGKGRTGSDSVFKGVEVKKHNLEHARDEKRIEDEKKICGYFVLATNKPAKELSMAKALVAYKQEWQVERIFERLKGPLQVIPIYMQLPEHIESMMYLLMSCAQIFTLMDREAKNTLAKREEKLTGLFPNNIKTASPKTEQMMDIFRHVGIVYMVNNGEVTASIPVLNQLQGKILDITGVDLVGFNPDYVVPRLECDYVKQIVIAIVQNAITFTQ